jgi:hypothetical protein
MAKCHIITKKDLRRGGGRIKRRSAILKFLDEIT